ncbi:MAG: cystathionine beta-lyase [Rickettsiales bacterium]
MRRDTAIITAGRSPFSHKGMVNAPVYRASTILFDSVDAYLAAGEGSDVYDVGYGEALDYSYGTSGTPTAHAFAHAMAELEGAESCVLAPSGLAALTGAFLAYLRPGDVFLVPDSVYWPVRRFCRHVLPRYDVTTVFYDPAVAPRDSGLFDKSVRMILLEAPGSLTFDMQDVPAYAAAAREAGVVSCMDNSWASPLHFRPLDCGIDLSVQAVTKYVGGHSDVLMGSVCGARARVAPVREYFRHVGVCVSPDDCYLAARGLRSLKARLDRHSASALDIARRCEAHDKIARVMFPALPSDPGHDLWKRDFSGAGGLFSVAFRQKYDNQALRDAINGLELFGKGASWGGYESLALPFDPNAIGRRLCYPEASCVRFFVGLEHPNDLWVDMEKMFATL